MIALLAIFLSGLTAGAVTRESSQCGGRVFPFIQRQPGASAILGPAFRLPVLRLRPVPEYIVGWPDGSTLTGRKASSDSSGPEMYWLLPFLHDGAGMVPAGQFFAWPLEI